MNQDNLNEQDRTPAHDFSSGEDRENFLIVDEPVGDLPPGQDEIEAARVGQEDQSVLIGAIPYNHDLTEVDDSVVAGDPDAFEYQAEVVGEEAIGGTTPTPDQNNIDEITAATGINTRSERPVNVLHEMEERDERRSELDVDYKEPEI